MIFTEVEKLKEKFNNSSDLLVKEVFCGNKNINFIFIKSMIDENNFIRGILSPLLDFGSKKSEISTGQPFDFKSLQNEVLKAMEVTEIEKEKCEEELSQSSSLYGRRRKSSFNRHC